MANPLPPIVESKHFRSVVLLLIGVNALVIGAETYPGIMTRVGSLLNLLDRAILFCFVLELILRFGATSPKHRFFLDGWNLFDLAIVAAGFVPGAEYFTVLRLLRVVRILRAVTFLPQLQKLVLALLKSLPSLGHILLLLAILFFAYGAAGTYLFRDVDPQHFGSLHQSLLSLFGVITLERWVDLMEGILQYRPFAWIYFVSFIMLGTFISMNFFVGVIVNNMQAAEEELEGKSDHDREALARIEAKLDRLSSNR